MANIMIVTDVISRPTVRLEGAIVAFGPTLRLTSQTWLLNSSEPVSSILRALLKHIGSVDKIFVADCTSNKAAWYNYGPEFESRLRQQWRQASKPSAALNSAAQRETETRHATKLFNQSSNDPVTAPQPAHRIRPLGNATKSRTG